MLHLHFLCTCLLVLCLLTKQNSNRLQIAFSCFVYPSLILAYMGQAAYLSKHHIIESDYQIGFYVSVPGILNLFSTIPQPQFQILVELISTFRCRKDTVASSCNRHSCCSGGKSSYHYGYLFDHQAMLCGRLLSEGQNSTHVV